ncbi:MAG: ABC transporter ATP-binding protein [Oscillospiraceae bacterium]|nr:ABC transporter ATP-binding protein [Oscillospiraceae bacterium]
MELLKAVNLSFSYQNKYQTVHAVKQVNCSFELGRTYAIVGKSGSGKTTFLSLLAGLELPTGGDVFFEGRSTREMDCDAYRRDHAAVIYQSYNLFPMLTAIENVIYPLKLKKVPKAEAMERARTQLTAVGIKEEEFARFPLQLSGGQQQRVAIARALAAGNQIILADEPTGNLDIGSGEQVVDILMRLAHEDGCAVIIVTHDLDIASQMDEVFTMRDGVLLHDE